MNIIILLGSVRTGRQSHKIAHYLEKQLIARGVETSIIDLIDEKLPGFGNSDDNPDGIRKTVLGMSRRLKQADGMLLVTPEYHGSFSGVLKNALDYFWEEFQRKPIGVAAVSSGKFGGINAANLLQHVILSMGGVALPTKLLVSDIHDSMDESAEPRDQKVVKYTQKFLDEFLWYTDAITEKRKLEQLYR